MSEYISRIGNDLIFNNHDDRKKYFNQLGISPLIESCLFDRPDSFDYRMHLVLNKNKAKAMVSLDYCNDINIYILDFNSYDVEDVNENINIQIANAFNKFIDYLLNKQMINEIILSKLLFVSELCYDDALYVGKDALKLESYIKASLGKNIGWNESDYSRLITLKK